MSKLENDEFGTRMKAYESVETARRFDESLPLYVRLDGRGFSKFTRGLDRPYDERLRVLMGDVTEALVKETKANAGYFQSDEISLLYDNAYAFDGKVQKIVSTITSTCTAEFAHGMRYYLPIAYIDKKPTFDCRAINLPDRTEAVNMMLWRHLDCTKNAVSMVAQSFFSHRELQGKKQGEMKSMLLDQHGIQFELDYPASFRYGTVIQPKTVELTVGVDDLTGIPEEYQTPGATFTRTRYTGRSVPLLQVANRVEVLFDGAEPVYRQSKTHEDPTGA